MTEPRRVRERKGKETMVAFGRLSSRNGGWRESIPPAWGKGRKEVMQGREECQSLSDYTETSADQVNDSD